MRRGPAALILTLCTVCAWSCESPPVVYTPDTLRARLPWIQPGTTTRKDVLLKLGLPAVTYENQRIFAYRVAVLPSGELGVATVLNMANDPRLMPWGQCTSLVLVFDDAGVLREHNVIVAENAP